MDLRVSTDSRTPIQKMRRCHLWKIADSEGIPYPPGAAKTEMIKILEANRIDVTQHWEFRQVHMQDEDGRNHTDLVPVVPEHATARKDIDYDRIIEERSKEHEKELESKNKEIDDQTAFMQKMMQRIEQLEDSTVPLESMSAKQLGIIAEKRGIEVKGIGKADMLKLLQ